MTDTDKLVAAILAAGRMARVAGEPSTHAYADEYVSMLDALKQKAAAMVEADREARLAASRRDRDSMRAP